MLRPPENPQNIYRFTFLRHGESIGNAQGLYQGQADYHLSETGFRQAHLLAEYWKKTCKRFDRIISSPLYRARETAETIAEALGLPVQYDLDLKERNSGKIAGYTPDEANRLYPQPAFTHLYQHVGETGESQWELFLRAGRAVQSLLELSPGSYLVVSHGGILNMVMYTILGIIPQPNFYGPRFRFANTAFAAVTYTPSEHAWRILSLNEQPHLPAAAAAEEGIEAGMEPMAAAGQITLEGVSGILQPDKESLSAILGKENQEIQPDKKGSECKYLIRRAVKKDIESLIPVFEEADRYHQIALPNIFRPQMPLETRQYLASIMEKEENVIFLAETDQKVIGMVFVYPRQTLEIPILVPRKWLVIDSLAVLPEARRCGVGNTLMERAHQWARDHNIHEVELNVYEFNDGAMKLYESMGYSTLRRQMRISLK